MWSASIAAFGRAQDKSTIIATVQYTDGTAVEERTYKILTETDLKSIVVGQVVAFNAADKLEQDKPLGPVDLPTIDDQPTPDQLARSAFFDDWRTYRGYLVAVTAGLLPSEDKLVVELRARLQAAFLPDYARSL